jgi:hypothetical protein
MMKKPLYLLYGNEHPFFWHDAIFWSILASILTLFGTFFDAK